MTAPAITLFDSRPPGFAVRWSEVSEIGFIETEAKPGGGVRYRVVLKSKGARYRIAQKEIAPELCVPFSSRETAQETLDGIRHLLAQGYSIRRAVPPDARA